MMKKLNLLVLFLFSGFYYAQVSVFTAMNSNDPNVVAQFVKANPKHPKTEELKKKLSGMRYTPATTTESESGAKAKKTALTPKKLERNIDKSKTSEDGSKTAKLLTHLFQNDPKSKQALLQIVNRSKCPLVVKVSGKKFYNFNVSSKNQEYIMVDKGQYTVSTSICGAKYSESKSLTANTVITLNNGL